MTTSRRRRESALRKSTEGTRTRFFFRPPGFPFFIALASACHCDQVGWVKVCVAAIDSFTVLLIWAMALRVTGSSRMQWLVVAAAALHPIFVAQPTDLRSEPLFMFLITGAVLALLTARSERAGLYLSLAGALLGFAALTRPAALVALPFFALAWIAGAPATRRRLACAQALALSAAAAAVVAPWSFYISAQHHEMILVNDTGGFNLWKGTHPELVRALRSPDRASYAERTRQFEFVTTPREAQAVAMESNSPMGRSAAWRRRATDRISSAPGAFLEALLGNMSRFWRPWLSPMEHGPVAVAGSAALLCSIYLLGGVGIAQTRASQPWLFWFVVLWFLVVTLAHSPFQTVLRYRMPLTDPLLIAFMGGGVVALRSGFGRGAARAASLGSDPASKRSSEFYRK